MIDGVWLGSLANAERISEFPLPHPDNRSMQIVAGPRDALWFTEYANRIGVVTLDGDFTEFEIPTHHAGACGIVEGSDRNVWLL